MEPNSDIAARCRNVTLLVLDCDGVLTDGRLYFTEAGEELKVFHVRDGFGLAEWHRRGCRTAIISGRNSPIVERRARELGIEFVTQGRDDKLEAFRELLDSAGVSAEQTAFVGDDTLDVPVMQAAGFAAAVADGHQDARNAAHYVTRLNGGRGAVREVIDLLLGSQAA